MVEGRVTYVAARTREEYEAKGDPMHIPMGTKVDTFKLQYSDTEIGIDADGSHVEKLLFKGPCHVRAGDTIRAYIIAANKIIPDNSVRRSLIGTPLEPYYEVCGLAKEERPYLIELCGVEDVETRIGTMGVEHTGAEYYNPATVKKVINMREINSRKEERGRRMKEMEETGIEEAIRKALSKAAPEA